MTTTEHETDPWLTVNEVAAQLRLSKMSVYRLINESFQLRAVRLGRSIRVRQSSVDTYLAESTIDGAA